MKITYKIHNKVPIVTSRLISTEPHKSQFYVVKKPSVSYTVQFADGVDFNPTVFSQSLIRGKFKVTSNTSDISITDVIVDDVPYYYEVVATDGSSLSKSFVELNSNFNVVEYNGRVYSEDASDPFEIGAGVSILTIPVMGEDRKTVSYSSKHISITVESKTACVAKANPFRVQHVTRRSVKLPSIYIFKGKKMYRLVESDIKLLSKKESLTLQINKVEPKGLVAGYDRSLYTYDKVSNTLFSKDPSVTADNILVEYTEFRSNHLKQFEDDAIQLRFSNAGYEVVEDGFDIKVTREAADDIAVYANPFLTKFRQELPKFLGITFNSVSESFKRGLVEYVDTRVYKDPSKVVYIGYNGLRIYQHKHSTFKAKPADLSVVYMYTDAVNPLKFKTEGSQKYVVSSIATSYSYEEVE